MSDLIDQPPAHAEDPRSRVRRTDRAVDDDGWIAQQLHSAKVCFIATSQDDQPFLNANLFWFDQDQHRIYFHTAGNGMTRDNVQGNPKVCFGIAEMGELIPADTALEFSTAYAGVVVFGRARIVDDRNEAEHGLYGLLQKYFPDLQAGEDYRAITADELSRTSVFAIDIESWSGKQKKPR